MTTRAELDADWEKLRKARADFEAERDASGVEYKLFIGNLDPETDDEELKALFEPYGSVKECCILRDRERKSKRSGFVKYFSKASAEAAIAGLHDRHTDKNSRSPLAVRYARARSEAPAFQQQQQFSQPSYNPYGQSTQYGQQQAQYGQQQGQYGQQQAQYGQQQAQYGQQQAQYGQQAQFGQQQAQSGYGQDPYANLGQQAAMAYGQQAMQQQTPSYGAQATGLGGGYRSGGGSGGGSQGFGAGRGPSGANLYVNNIDRMATEADVRAMFSEFGTVVSCKLFSDNGYGFVSYDSAQSAQTAIQCLNGMKAADGNRSLEVSIKKDKGSSGGSRYNPY